MTGRNWQPRCYRCEFLSVKTRGVAQGEGETKAEEPIARAEVALCQAKRSGRNAVAPAPHGAVQDRNTSDGRSR